jgi:DNA-binding transcriptional LysR family regulator
VDLVLLRSLLAIADAGTITDAADRVNISQSALSRRLQQLEADLGAELMVRGRHGVDLTDLGREVVDQARGIVASYDRLRQDITEQLGLVRGTVRVGAGATVTSYVLPQRIADFQSTHPGIRFFVKEAGSREIASEVSAGELEIGIVTVPVPSRDLDIVKLSTDEIVLVARADHDFAQRRVRVADLQGQPFVAFEEGSAIRQIIDAALRAAGVEIDVEMELRSIPSILRMVATTGYLAFVSRVSLPAEPTLRAIPVRGLTVSCSFGLATRRGIPLSAPAEAFAAMLRSTDPTAQR